MALDLTQIPWSTLSTLGIAFLVSLATSLLNRKFIDKVKFAQWREEINQWNSDRTKARKTEDKKLMAKVKKQEAQILQIQSKMFKQQMKTTLITFVPLLLMWQLLPRYFGVAPVAYIPLLGDFPISFYIWYLICSFFTSTLVSRLFGLDLGMGGAGVQPAQQEEAKTTKKTQKEI